MSFLRKAKCRSRRYFRHMDAKRCWSEGYCFVKRRRNMGFDGLCVDSQKSKSFHL